MKNVVAFFSCYFLMTTFLHASATNLVYNKLCEINKEWLNHADAFQLEDETYVPESDVALIQLHLQLVEHALRNTDTKHLTQTQLENRKKCLTILNAYWQAGIFPINSYHTKRTPYFIDNVGTACAVGQLVIETGNKNFANQIQRENNYAYILDLEKMYPQLKNWADENGFTLDELKWIQPMYSSSCFEVTGGVTNPTCYGYNDGSVDLEIPVGGTPPFYVSGPICWNLPAGTYTYIITDADSNEYIQTYTLVDPEPIVPSIHIINNVSSYAACDASLTVTTTGGVAPLNYFWLGCSDSFSETTDTIDSVCSGEYKIVINDAVGCSGVSDCISIGTFASLQENKISFTYKLFPNPAQDVLKIEVSNTVGYSTIHLTDLSGRILLKAEFENEFSINIHDFEIQTGCYFLTLEINDEAITEQVFFVE